MGKAEETRAAAGKKMNEIRLLMGYKESEVAMVCGVTVQDIKDFEAGKSVPAPDVFDMLITTFCPRDEFLLKGLLAEDED